MWANEAQEIENEVWGEEHSWEYEWGEGGEWHEYPSPEIYAYDASFTKGKGKKGKWGKGNKGSKGGKDKGTKGGKGKYGGNTKGGRGYIPSPGAKPCRVSIVCPF